MDLTTISFDHIRTPPEASILPLRLVGGGRRIDQITPTFDLRDAIADEALVIRDSLRAAGFQSAIYSPLIAPESTTYAEHFRAESVGGSDLLVYHLGIGSEVSDAASRLGTRRALWYHNITPSAAFWRYAPATAALLDAGRRELVRIINRFDVLIAHSNFSARELAAHSNTPVDVVPFVLDVRRFETDAAPVPAPAIRWLSVGRITPSKGLLRLVRAFATFAGHYPESQLVLAGKYAPSDAYYLRLLAEIERLDIGARVLFTGSVSNTELVALYRSSTVYVTLSEHEGFCVPLVEAMNFDLPIVASASGAIPETLGEAGVMVKDDATSQDIAGLIDVVLSDSHIHERLLAAQRDRRKAFTQERIAERMSEILGRALLGRKPTLR